MIWQPRLNIQAIKEWLTAVVSGDHGKKQRASHANSAVLKIKQSPESMRMRIAHGEQENDRDVSLLLGKGRSGTT